MSTPPKPPYGTHDIHVGTPLTAEQRATIVKWLPTAWAWQIANGWKFDTPPPSNLAALPDDQLINQYGMAYAAIQIHDTSGITLNPITAVQQSGLSVPNPIHSLEDFLNLLSNKNLWIRVAEFGIGGILLAVGVNAVLRPGQSLASAGGMLSPAGRVVRAVHNSAHGSFQ